ncbi:MAG: HEAT repeat domain-containing protein [Synechococcaceae cyanobacterium]|nr:HEAT repeat domain-containing protein [Synechococcaceae cyanobacterium]
MTPGDASPAAPEGSPDAVREAIASGDPARAMPALAGLRELAEPQATPLLLLGLEQSTFMIRSLACAGLGVKRSEAGWSALQRSLHGDEDANVRAEAANALASYGVQRAWPLLRAAFAADNQWLVRCSILSALAEQPAMQPGQLLELASLAIADGDGTVRVGGAEILGRLVRDHRASPQVEGAEAAAQQARALLQRLQGDDDHRVVAAALDGLQG